MSVWPKIRPSWKLMIFDLKNKLLSFEVRNLKFHHTEKWSFWVENSTFSNSHFRLFFESKISYLVKVEDIFDCKLYFIFHIWLFETSVILNWKFDSKFWFFIENSFLFQNERVMQRQKLLDIISSRFFHRLISSLD